MADEPERRIVGVIHAELERQVREEAHGGFVSGLDSYGCAVVDMEVDLTKIAKAVLEELKQ